MIGVPAGRALAVEVRAELAAVTPHRACCRRAEAAAFAGFAWRAAPARRARLVRAALTLGHRPGDEPPDWRWEGSAEHCRVAYLRGLFLTRGSLSITEGRTHLEFVLDAGEAELLARRFTAMGLPATFRVRRGRGVVTWKSADTVATFLRMAGAGSAVLDLEARRVARVLRGELNRLLNAEAANLGRSVGSAVRQLEAIDALAADGRLMALPRDARLVAGARREAPSATLAELAEATGLHRSSVQRELARIECLAAAVAGPGQVARPRGTVRPAIGGSI